MAAGQERDQRKLDDAILAEDDRGRGFAHSLDLGADFFEAIDQLGFRGGKCCHVGILLGLGRKG